MHFLIITKFYYSYLDIYPKNSCLSDKAKELSYSKWRVNEADINKNFEISLTWLICKLHA